MDNIRYVRKIAAGIFISIIVILSTVPFLWVLASSFKTNAQILSATGSFTQGFYIQNYAKAFQIAPLVIFYRNSIFVAFFGTLLNLVIFSMAAYVLAKCEFRLKGFLTMMFSLALLIPGAALLQPLYQTLTFTRLYNTLWGIILVYIALGLPTTLFIMISYFQTIPKTLEEAAYIDGAGFLRTFVQIVLPLAKPAFATAGVLQFLLCWNEFQFALTLTTGVEKRTLPIALYYFKSSFASDYGAMFAATVLVTIPSIIVYVLMQKQVIAGLVSGAVKE